MTLIVPQPEKKFRLHDGTLGTEADAIRDAIRTLEARRQVLDDDLDALRRRLATAEGS